MSESDQGLTGRQLGEDREAEDSVEDRHGATIDPADEQPRPEPEQEEDAVQIENAETSEDQPSEG